MRAPLDSLTPREREVLDLIRRGLMNEEIAARLGISLDGAKYHVSQILSKLGVSSRNVDPAAMDLLTTWCPLPPLECSHLNLDEVDHDNGSPRVQASLGVREHDDTRLR